MEDNGNEVINFSVLVILGVLVNMHVFMKRSGGTRNLQIKFIGLMDNFYL
jgi:hypothetical protein